MPWVVANSNLALVKYWGKSDDVGKHPAGASLSVTLDGLSSAAEVSFDRNLHGDLVEGPPAKAALPILDFIGAFRARFSVPGSARIKLYSNFPVAAGLASSASSFAALAKAAAVAAGLELPDQELAALARLGSGSACRSMFGGFVEWRPADGGSLVTPLAPPSHWPLAILVAVTSEGPKRVSSRDGMARTSATSPYYRAWLETGAADVETVRRAVAERDLQRMGEVMERNCLRMHAAAFAADPPLLYWEPATIAVMRRVWELRESGREAYFSIDAGPQVKVICRPADGESVAAELEAVSGVTRVIRSRPGGAPVIVDDAPSWAREARAR